MPLSSSSSCCAGAAAAVLGERMPSPHKRRRRGTAEPLAQADSDLSFFASEAKANLSARRTGSSASRKAIEQPGNQAATLLAASNQVGLREKGTEGHCLQLPHFGDVVQVP